MKSRYSRYSGIFKKALVTFDPESGAMGRIKVPVHKLCVAVDDLRPVMQYVLVTKQHVVATDAHVLVRHVTSEVFDQGFIDCFPFERFLIHWSAWAKLTEMHVFKIEWSTISPCTINVTYRHDSRKDYTLTIRVKEEKEVGTYPRYDAVIPEASTLEAVGMIGIQPDLLAKLHHAMCEPGCNYGVVLMASCHADTPDRSHASRAIVVRAMQNEETPGAVGIIMPMMITGDNDKLLKAY